MVDVFARESELLALRLQEEELQSQRDALLAQRLAQAYATFTGEDDDDDFVELVMERKAMPEDDGDDFVELVDAQLAGVRNYQNSGAAAAISPLRNVGQARTAQERDGDAGSEQPRKLPRLEGPPDAADASIAVLGSAAAAEAAATLPQAAIGSAAVTAAPSSPSITSAAAQPPSTLEPAHAGPAAAQAAVPAAVAPPPSDTAVGANPSTAVEVVELSESTASDSVQAVDVPSTADHVPGAAPAAPIGGPGAAPEAAPAAVAASTPPAAGAPAAAAAPASTAAGAAAGAAPPMPGGAQRSVASATAATQALTALSGPAAAVVTKAAINVASGASAGGATDAALPRAGAVASSACAGNPAAAAPAPEEGHTIECMCCFDSVPADQVTCAGSDAPSSSTAAAGCGHYFCAGCMTQYVLSAVKDRKFPVPCPMGGSAAAAGGGGAGAAGTGIGAGAGGGGGGGCRMLLSRDAVVAALEKHSKDLQAFGLLEAEQAIPSQLRIFCPHKDCSMPLQRPDQDDMPAAGPIACPACNRAFCLRCLIPGWHHGYTCADFQKLPAHLRSAEDAAMLQYSARQQWKQCPHCKQMVERSEGCNHMKCRCGREFCYACGAQYHNRRAVARPSCRCPLFDVPLLDGDGAAPGGVGGPGWDDDDVDDDDDDEDDDDDSQGDPAGNPNPNPNQLADTDDDIDYDSDLHVSDDDDSDDEDDDDDDDDDDSGSGRGGGDNRNVDVEDLPLNLRRGRLLRRGTGGAPAGRPPPHERGRPGGLGWGWGLGLGLGRGPYDVYRADSGRVHRYRGRDWRRDRSRSRSPVDRSQGEHGLGVGVDYRYRWRRQGGYLDRRRGRFSSDGKGTNSEDDLPLQVRRERLRRHNAAGPDSGRERRREPLSSDSGGTDSDDTDSDGDLPLQVRRERLRRHNAGGRDSGRERRREPLSSDSGGTDSDDTDSDGDLPLQVRRERLRRHNAAAQARQERSSRARGCDVDLELADDVFGEDLWDACQPVELSVGEDELNAGAAAGDSDEEGSWGDGHPNSAGSLDGITEGEEFTDEGENQSNSEGGSESGDDSGADEGEEDEDDGMEDEDDGAGGPGGAPAALPPAGYVPVAPLPWVGHPPPALAMQQRGPRRGGRAVYRCQCWYSASLHDCPWGEKCWFRHDEDDAT
ncbi:hypothetical protein GPECTOR_26g467 [Gonium pectorale]|uniref:RBR-type E3 ubiquitin transferase n=1 Tax=Gonium pectorale TaxID=33097 RepID=A0A150GFG1_GONPE|nr:hypothetical protein GPECTOR_26g467 [Gonium pectorale]|eukprot:KXZ48564.1 hypothetical protein GPECTOR_26g467 [Gonium pectorale]